MLQTISVGDQSGLQVVVIPADCGLASFFWDQQGPENDVVYLVADVAPKPVYSILFSIIGVFTNRQVT